MSEWELSRADYRAEAVRIGFLAFRQRTWPGLLRGGGAAVFLMTPLSLFSGAEWWYVPVGFLAVLPVVTLLMFSRGYVATLTQVDQSARADLDVFSDRSERFLVEVRFLDGLAMTGQDTGVLWFEGPKMLFMGRYSEFALAPGEAKSARPEGWMEILGIGTSVIELHQLGVRGPRRLAIVDVEGSRRTTTSQDSLEHKIRGFMNQASAHPLIASLPGNLPPSSLGPRAGRLAVPLATLFNPVLSKKAFVDRNLVAWYIVFLSTSVVALVEHRLLALCALILACLVLRPNAVTAWYRIRTTIDWATVWLSHRRDQRRPRK